MWEWQDRGVLHLHVLVRIARLGAPSASELREASRTAVATSKVDGSLVVWGEQADCRVFRADGDGAKTIWYLSKALNYVLKDVAREAGPLTPAWHHLRRLHEAARATPCALGCRSRDCMNRSHDRYGARSHVVSASRRTRSRTGWSFTGLTRKVQRLLRAEWRAEHAPGPAAAPVHAAVTLHGAISPN